MATVPFTCQPPNEFDYTNINDWPRWKNRFERYRSVSGLKNKTESEQIDCLIYCMGDQAESILTALKLTEDEGKKYDKVVDAFENHFIGKRNTIYERAKFNLTVQREGTSVDEFITTLHNLAKYCNFGTLTEELIRDRIVAGVLDRKLSEKMQLDSNLTLEKATTMARQSERVKLQQSTVHQDSKQVKIDRVKAPGYKNRENKTPLQMKNRKFFEQTKSVCSWCGGPWHKEKKMCPATNAVCNFCKKKGHFSKVCKKRSEVREVTTSNDTALVTTKYDTAFLGSVNTGPHKWSALVSIKNKQIQFKVDTGADVNVIPKTEVDLHFPEILLKDVDRTLAGPDGKMLQTEGMFHERLTYGDKHINTNIYVVSKAEKALLSGDTSEKLGIVKRLNEVSACDNDLFKEFSQLFVGLGQSSMKYKITLKSEAEPYALTTPRRVPIPLMNKVKQKLDEMTSSGVIEVVEEPTNWCSPMVIVPKPDGDIRICVDLSRLNKYIKREIYPMPVSEHILAQLGQSKYFSKLDAYWGFWQVALEEESQILTTFISPFGRYKFKRLPFGIASAPEFFQKQMSQILSGLEGVVCNIDDILIRGQTEEEHDHRLRATLKRLVAAGITLNKSKCQFRTQSVRYLGHLIDEKGLHPNEQKVQAIIKMPPPKNVSELKSFLGMVNYHMKFLPNCATVAQPLNDLLKTSTTWIWDAPQQKAFKELKLMLSSTPVLAKFDYHLETIVSADASSYGLGAVLKQRQQDGNILPVAFASRSLNSSERRYAQIEKEGLALVWACERFRDYVTGIHIKLETDHRPLVAIFSSKMLDEITPRLQRMKLRLMRYSFDIFHTPGKQLITADTLSRQPLQEVEDNELHEEITAYVQRVIESTPMSDHLMQQIKQHQQADSILMDVQRFCREGWPEEKSKISASLRPYWLSRADISEIDNLLLKDNRLIIPTTLRKDILLRIHEGHLGINKCRMRARASVWWPGLSTEINELVTDCEKCIKEKKNHREPLLASTFPDRPWQKVAMDLFYLERKWYLLVTDYYSRYPEIALLHGLTANNVITHIKSIFARHGIPEVVISDNGPQFLPLFTSAFGKFAEEWNFQHVTSSPKYAQSNGFVEAAVKIIKRSLKKEGDSYIALLSYRSTPLENGFSPAELLFGRRLRSRLPVISSQLQPQIVNQRNLSKIENNQKMKQKKMYDKRHRTSPLEELPIDKRVWITDLKDEGKVVSKANTPRSYIIQTKNGLRRRNRFNLIPLRGMSEINDENDESTDVLEEEEIPIPSTSTSSERSTTSNATIPENSQDLTPVQNNSSPNSVPESNDKTVRSRFGRIIKRPNKLDL